MEISGTGVSVGTTLQMSCGAGHEAQEARLALSESGMWQGGERGGFLPDDFSFLCETEDDLR